MSLEKINYTKDWTSSVDFPTREVSETRVRADIQYLYDEIKVTFNRLIDALEASTGTTSGASQVGATTITGISGTNVQAILESISTLAQTLSSNMNTLVSSVAYDSSNGNFTITKFDGSSSVIQTELEKVVTNFSYNESTKKLTLTYPDGTTTEISLASLVDEYTFTNSDSVTWSVSGHTVTAYVSTEYYSILESLKNSAESASNNSSSYANTSRQMSEAAEGYRDLSKSYAVGTDNVTREGDSTDNAKYYSEMSEQHKETASGYASSASSSATSASSYSQASAANSLKAEGYALGTANGSPVGSSSPYYRNNAKYYLERMSAVLSPHTVTLGASGWSSNEQSVTIVGTNMSVVMVTPSPGSVEDYCSSGVICYSATHDSASNSDTFVFKCSTVPTSDLTVYITER